MVRGWSNSLLVLCCGCLLAGCASPHFGKTHTFDVPAPPPLSGDSLSKRGKLVVDASALLPTSDLDERLQFKRQSPANYISVSAADCQCRAAANSSLANLIEVERGITDCQDIHLPRKAKACELKDDLLALRAVDDRNRTAGTALELYYKLAEAEAGLDVLAASQAAVDHALENVADLRDKGLKIEIDEAALRRRKIEFSEQQAEAELGRDQAHGALKVLLGLADEDTQQIWPEADLKGQATPLDVEAAVADGLAARADLAILRRLAGALSMSTLPGARSALSQHDASLGSSSSGTHKLLMLLTAANSDREIAARRTQLGMLLADRERMAIEEIRSAAAAVTARLRQAALAQEMLLGRRRRLAELERLREVGNATAFEVATEKAEIIKAEGEVMRKLVAWRLAEVKLKQAQGLLAAECGYQHDPCCGNCGRSCRHGACTVCGPLESQGQSGFESARSISGVTKGGPRIVKIDHTLPDDEELPVVLEPRQIARVSATQVEPGGKLRTSPYTVRRLK